MTAPFAFWYLFSSNGADAFLLDLIRRPGECLARLVTYRQGRPPHIVRHGFEPGELNGVQGTLGVKLNGIALDALGCRSTLPGMHLDARFAFDRPAMRFVPAFMPWLFDTVPDFRSHYGSMEAAVCEGAEYRGVPVTCSTYSLESLSKARWVLISAPRFAGTDLAFEISATRLLGRWMPTAWLFHNGREYRVNSPFDSLFRLKIKSDEQSGERVFEAIIHAGGLRFEIDARGPLDQFARLETEGDTNIHTTLFGTCRVKTPATMQTFVAERTCLLEVKN